MFASRAISSTPFGHRCTSSAKFKSTRQINHDDDDRPRLSDPEVEPHPRQGLVCALVFSLFCPILGIIALFYAIRAVRSHNQGFYAEATVDYKKSVRWSLMAFILGLIIGSTIAFTFSVKAYLFV